MADLGSHRKACFAHTAGPRSGEYLLGCHSLTVEGKSGGRSFGSLVRRERVTLSERAVADPAD